VGGWISIFISRNLDLASQKRSLAQPYFEMH
jgi:hypothetical protein